MNLAQATHEGILLDHLKLLFSDTVTHIKSRKQSRIKDPNNGAYLELDVWIPEYSISFEFQDAYHYVPIWYKQITQEQIHNNDEIKKSLANQSTTTLVQVPCWWDGSLESLVATITFQRPDLFPNLSHPISLNPHAEFLQVRELPDVGGLMLASFPSDSDFSSSVSSSTWWIGEKYDGVRLCWNSPRNIIFSRTGKVLRVLPAIVGHLPSTTMCVDGELWFGRGYFSQVSLLFFETRKLIDWNSLRALLFDVSTYRYHAQSFETRYSQLLSVVNTNNPIGMVVSRTLCKNTAHLNQIVRNILDGDGEGVIMRKCGSLYDIGRSQNLLKLKRFHGDQEAIVVSVGKGEQPVSVKLPTGQSIAVPSHHVHVPNIQIGDVITLSFDSNFRRTSPVNPHIHKIRSDLSWQEVISNFRSDRSSLNAKSQVKGVISPTTTARRYLEGIAKSLGLDPLLPSTWYSLYSQFSSLVKKKFKKSYFRLLKSVFSEIRFNAATCSNLSWSDVDKRREFFENYATRNGFNALNPVDWYSQSIKSILSVKGALGIVRHYGNDVPQTLLHLFPDIGFVALGDRSWWNDDTGNAKKLLENYAAEKGFDARNPNHWHSQSSSQLMDIVGINIIARHYGSVTKALLRLFPDIGLDRLKLQLTYYKKIEHRKKTIEQYAVAKFLNPYKSQDWYNIAMNLPGMNAITGIRALLFYHGSNLLQAIMDLFPNIGLEKARLHANYQASKRRLAFDQYAAQAAFDPLVPENWYRQSKAPILASKGVSRAISYYNNSLPRALVDLYPNIGLEELKLHIPAWREERDRRIFFEDYAREHLLDPLNPDHWYTSPLSNNSVPQKSAEILSYHSNDVRQAVIDLFPELKLVKSYFDPEKYWGDPTNRKKFFVDYASVHNIDPLEPQSWNSQPISRIMAAKGANKVMAYHSTVTKALCELFSDAEFSSRQLQLKYK